MTKDDVGYSCMDVLFFFNNYYDVVFTFFAKFGRFHDRYVRKIDKKCVNKYIQLSRTKNNWYGPDGILRFRKKFNKPLAIS